MAYIIVWRFQHQHLCIYLRYLPASGYHGNESDQTGGAPSLLQHEPAVHSLQGAGHCPAHSHVTVV